MKREPGKGRRYTFISMKRANEGAKIHVYLNEKGPMKGRRYTFISMKRANEGAKILVYLNEKGQ